ncbi:virulence factor TspB C-terminal domain-related protein [Acinetobacter sp. MD2]|uniref:virulence factor TspB C-terminal domain-related protein n=1 Tax=Acinetobacter sp. MD2 TaxID=2600066 RepID=UPI002D1E5A13|nr:virulence factor TspB C-terminal domain-related protein [Acinetobacter sp. MD2]MEB3767721.1 hypothetical protein [Acinetobacter sp. MD2]
MDTNIGDDMRNMGNSKSLLIHRTNVFLLVAMLIVSQFIFVKNASASLAGSTWSLSNPVSHGATVVYDGVRNVLINGANKVVTGTATIAPVAADIAKFIGRVGAAAVVTTVLDGLLNGVDYVLDPANNTVQYKPKVASTTCNQNGLDCRYAQYLYKYDGKFYSSGSAACSAFDTRGFGSISPTVYFEDDYCKLMGGSNNYNGNIGAALNVIINPNYDETEANNQNETKTRPLSDVAQQVLDKAKAGDADAQALVRAVAADIVQDAEKDDTKAKPIVTQLDNTATYPSDTTADTKTDTKTNADGTTTSTSTTDIPAACGWMPSVCEAMQVIIQKPVQWADGIKAAYNDAVDYFKGEPDSSDDELDIKQEDDNQEAPNLNFSGQCPASIQLASGQIADIDIDWKFEFTDFCTILSTYVRPVLIAMGAFIAALILGGVRTTDD